MSKYKKKRESAKLDLTPLIDVVFLLLIFFMLATSFDERSAFKIDLPKSTAAKTKSTLKEVQVLVDKEKNIYLVNNPISINKENIIKRPQDGIFKILSVGRLEEEKNLFMLMHALNKIRGKYKRDRKIFIWYSWFRNCFCTTLYKVC